MCIVNLKRELSFCKSDLKCNQWEKKIRGNIKMKKRTSDLSRLPKKNKSNNLTRLIDWNKLPVKVGKRKETRVSTCNRNKLI